MTSSILDARPQAPSRSPLAAPDYGPLPALLLILTAVTGIVDAVSILSLGRVFVANMTGNVVFAGFAAVGAPGFSLSSSSSRSPSGRLHAPSSLVAQSLRSLAPQSRRHGRPCGSLGSAPSARALPASPGASHGTAAIAGGAFGPAVTGVLAALLAVALGVQNAKARKLAVPDMTTTVLTMTLTGLAADFRAAFCAGSTERAKARTTFSRRLIVIGTMLAGAVASAALVLGVSPLSALAVATALLASVAAAAALAARHPAAWRVPATR